jgi:hypothetical protein
LKEIDATNTNSLDGASLLIKNHATPSRLSHIIKIRARDRLDVRFFRFCLLIVMRTSAAASSNTELRRFRAEAEGAYGREAICAGAHMC